jgi:hypothetical protein
MTGVIVKVSYNKIGDSKVDCMRMGCCFFLTDTTVATCNHIFKRQESVGQKQYKFIEYYVIIEDNAIPFITDDIFEYPDANINLIRLKKSFDIVIPKVSNQYVKHGTLVYNETFIRTIRSHVDYYWDEEKLIVTSNNVNHTPEQKSGYVSGHILITQIITDPAKEHPYKNAKCFFTSYGGDVHESIGTAVFSSITNELVGMIILGTKKTFGDEVEGFYVISSVHFIAAMKKAGIIKKPWWKFW